MASKIIDYQTDDGGLSVDVRLDSENNTVWLTQKQMADLFDRDQSVIARHIRAIFKDGELNEKPNMQKMHIPNSDKPVSFYNLNVIISVGYRVKSKRGTQFRIWATRILRDHLMNGSSQAQKEAVYIDNRQFHISVGDIRIEGNTLDIEKLLSHLEKLIPRLRSGAVSPSDDAVIEYLDEQVSAIKNKDRSKWQCFIQELLNEESCFRRIVDASTETKVIVEQVIDLFT